ncbi:MAG: isoprenylcysteine carboxylmethyltransferase family protein [Candidatus Thorarchaeota archaeon]|nr:isoprenylcysteine carboxylmethyltransferase family protein [Candidatus Thorarchaeota archaeon]
MARKIVGLSVFLVYYNICLLIFANGIYYNMITLAIIALDQLVASADKLIRPVTPTEDVDSSTRMVGFLLLLHPFFLILIFYDNLLLTSTLLIIVDNPIISYIGIIVYIIGGTTVILSRRQLGRYGDGTTALKRDHKLLTQGIYSYIRHPLYAGALIGRIGIGLSFRGYFSAIFFILIYFIVFRKRMDIEEGFLTVEFGEEYESYMKRTKRLFPYIY